MTWKVMPLCKAQLTDINPDDILSGGLYRKCNTYKGGGGYDKFPEIYQKRYDAQDGLNFQFVVQVMGCPLKCPYCYVTPDGIYGPNAKNVSTDKLIEDFNTSRCKVFHLMGGAPALYLEQWTNIIDRLGETKVFHSDFLLIEKYYDADVLYELAKRKRTLYAVSIKGGTAEEFLKNTRVLLNEKMFWSNFDNLVEIGVPIYLTYTGMDEESIQRFNREIENRYGEKGKGLLEDSFSIKLIHYNALDYKRTHIFDS